MLSFILLAVLMTVGALGVVTLRQPVHAALSLVGTLLTLAITYVTLQAHFLAAVQVIVYAGAIMVLFLFVIMLLNAQGDDGASRLGWLRFAAYLTGAVAVAGLLITVFADRVALPDATTIRAVLQGGGADVLGEALFTQFILAFQLVGVLLLTGIIGAVALVQRRATAADRSQLGLGEPALAAVPAETAAGPEQTVPGQDDLKRIKGIGTRLEGLLNQNGIYTFTQLATLTDDEVVALDAQLGEFRGRIGRDGWLEQARELSGEREYA